MRRFYLLLLNEFKLFRTAIPIHLIGILQPTVMYLLMAAILVQPTFDMEVARPTTAGGRALVAAMAKSGRIHPAAVHPHRLWPDVWRALDLQDRRAERGRGTLRRDPAADF